MQLQPKSIDSSQNVIDIRKARNANELITVIGRINTALRLKQSQFQSLNVKGRISMPLSKLYEGMRWVLATQAELLAAVSTIHSLSDAKRDRCATALSHLSKDVLALKRQLMYRVNAASANAVSQTLDSYSLQVHDFLRPVCEKLFSIRMYDNGKTYVAYIARNVQTPDNFTSPEVCIKLLETESGCYISAPHSPFIDTDYVPVSTAKSVDSFMLGVLEYTKKPAPNPKPEKLLRIEGVLRVDVTDTLNLHMDAAVRPSDVNGILRTVLPIIKRALNREDQFEVLHRFNNQDGDKCLQFCIGSRKVLDPRLLARLTRLLGMSKAQVAQMNTLLETP